MRRADGIRELFMPWAGLVAGTIGAGFAHQFGSEGSFDNCSRFSPIPLLIVALFCLLVVAIAGLESWHVLRGESETPARRLVATISVGTVFLFVMAILLPMIASLVISPCFQ